MRTEIRREFSELEIFGIFQIEHFWNLLNWKVLDFLNWRFLEFFKMEILEIFQIGNF